MNEVPFLAASEMARQVREKKLSPVELMEAHLRRIEKWNPRLNALVSLDPERSRAQARAAEAALTQSAPLGPLHGVPLTIKSSIDVAGLRCEAGTTLRAGYVPGADAPLVARLRAAGALVLGTTNVPEMLMAYETENPLYGRTQNPWDWERTPGGSSGGEVAAIAAGLSAGGVGSDGGGSIRVPAHFSGICGLKPTPGRIPATGHFPPSQGPFARLGVVGPMARTVADLELLFSVMAGPDPGDGSSVPLRLLPVHDPELQDLRIGFFEEDGRVPVTPETRAAVQTAAQGLAQAGFKVERFLPPGLKRVGELWETFFCLCGEMLLAPLLGERARELPILKEFRRSAPAPTPLAAETLLRAWLESDNLRVELAARREAPPVLLCPVSSVPAFRHGERAWSVEGKRVGYLEAMSYSQWFNLLGWPAAVVPVGRSPEGLPIGVQVVGRPYEDEVVLAVARHLERTSGGWQPPPLEPISASG